MNADADNQSQLLSLAISPAYLVYLLLTAASIFLCGCTSEASRAAALAKWFDYEGPQQKWPTEAASYVRRNSKYLPIYENNPPKPYDVIGKVRIGAHLGLDGAAKLALQHGADALVFEDSESGQAITGRVIHVVTLRAVRFTEQALDRAIVATTTGLNWTTANPNGGIIESAYGDKKVELSAEDTAKVRRIWTEDLARFLVYKEELKQKHQGKSRPQN